MLDKIFSVGLDLFAFVMPISIAATNIAFFPLAALWLFGGTCTLKRWPPLWGLPEKFFLAYLGISLVSALTGLDPLHSLKEIKNEDSYVLIAVVLMALLREENKTEKLWRLFMLAATVTAIWGLVQIAVGVNQNDKSNGVIYALPQALAHWPRPVLDKLSMLNGRAMGTRGHPLAFAECLLFNWAFVCCIIQSAQGRTLWKWLGVLTLIGSALVVSQSRGPWIAAIIIFILAFALSSVRKPWLLVSLGFLVFIAVLKVPSIHQRTKSILDRSHHSNSERLHMWKSGYDLWKNHPFFGIGPGNVPKVSASYQTPEEKVWGRWGHLHSTYVNFLAERGALGLLAFLLYFAVLMREIWHAMRRHRAHVFKHALFLGTWLGMLGFLIYGVTETAYNTAVVNMTLYFVVGLALSVSRRQTPSA